MPKIWVVLFIVITIASLGGAVTTLVLYWEQEQNYAEENAQWQDTQSEYQAAIDAQRQSKNDIRTQWENQLLSNDLLVERTIDTQDAIAQFLAGEITEAELQTILGTLENQLDTNADAKEQTRDAVEKIYQRDNEDQDNRANPDGIR